MKYNYNSIRTNNAKFCLIAGALLVAYTDVHAAEGGSSMYPNGAESYVVGAMPPPGLYKLFYGNHYRADRANDNNGNNLNIPGFKVQADIVAGRLAWVTGIKVLGGDLAFQLIVPLVDLSVSVAGASQSKRGIGDITTGFGIGYHHSPSIHSVVGVDLMLPTGDYKKTDLANPGKNHSAFDVLYAVTYIDPKGFNADARIGYTVNQRNNATDYTSGDEFHFDYSAGWALGNRWTAGVGGYFYQQVTDDVVAGAPVANNRGRAVSFGPSIKYDGKGWFGAVKLEREMNVKNRTQGTALWIKALLPF